MAKHIALKYIITLFIEALDIPEHEQINVWLRSCSDYEALNRF